MHWGIYCAIALAIVAGVVILILALYGAHIIGPSAAATTPTTTASPPMPTVSPTTKTSIQPLNEEKSILVPSSSVILEDEYRTWLNEVFSQLLEKLPLESSDLFVGGCNITRTQLISLKRFANRSVKIFHFTSQPTSIDILSIPIPNMYLPLLEKIMLEVFELHSGECFYINRTSIIVDYFGTPLLTQGSFVTTGNDGSCIYYDMSQYKREDQETVIAEVKNEILDVYVQSDPDFQYLHGYGFWVDFTQDVDSNKVDLFLQDIVDADGLTNATELSVTQVIS